MDTGHKREFERELVETETLVVEMRDAGGRSFAGRTKNLSPGGAFVEAKEEVPVGTELQLFIGSARSAAALRTVGTVVHSQPGVGFGVRFLDTDEDTRKYVSGFIHRHCLDNPKK